MNSYKIYWFLAAFAVFASLVSSSSATAIGEGEKGESKDVVESLRKVRSEIKIKEREAKNIIDWLKHSTGKQPAKPEETEKQIKRLRDLKVLPKNSLFDSSDELSNFIFMMTYWLESDGSQLKKGVTYTVPADVIKENIKKYSQYKLTLLPYLRDKLYKLEGECKKYYRFSIRYEINSLDPVTRVQLSDKIQTFLGWSPETPPKNLNLRQPSREQIIEGILKFIEKQVKISASSGRTKTTKVQDKKTYAKKLISNCKEGLYQVCRRSQVDFYSINKGFEMLSLDDENDFITFYAIFARICDVHLTRADSKIWDEAYKVLVSKDLSCF